MSGLSVYKELNQSLIDRGYLSEGVIFEDENTVRNQKVAQVIERLLESVDNNRTIRDDLLLREKDHLQVIDSLKTDQSLLRKRVDTLESKSISQERYINQLTAQIDELSNSVQTNIKQHNKTKSQLQTVLQSSNAEFRRKDLQIDQLQEKLVARQLGIKGKVFSLYSLPITPDAQPKKRQKIAESPTETQKLSPMERFHVPQKETMTLLSDLYDIIYSLIQDNNSKTRYLAIYNNFIKNLVRFISKIANYDGKISFDLKEEYTQLTPVEINSPPGSASTAHETKEELVKALQLSKTESENILRQFSSQMNELYSSLGNAFELNELSADSEVASRNGLKKQLQERETQIESLRRELESVTHNWKAAIETMEKWKKYRTKKGI
ncbi:BA75_02726T0 [Komagataella pastoris]|uniref:BA75_02726T0 n=1 Tax=Komagataella pastoris TaxID=4922 RepID=A0A1B2JBE4_PICPA|nr:BA75_02726T0 [Komagataella pastoris]